MPRVWREVGGLVGGDCQERAQKAGLETFKLRFDLFGLTFISDPTHVARWIVYLLRGQYPAYVYTCNASYYDRCVCMRVRNFFVYLYVITVHVCMCICMCTCMCVRMCAWICVCVGICVNVCACEYAQVYICELYTRTYTYFTRCISCSRLLR